MIGPNLDRDLDLNLDLDLKQICTGIIDFPTEAINLHNTPGIIIHALEIESNLILISMHTKNAGKSKEKIQCKPTAPLGPGPRQAWA